MTYNVPQAIYSCRPRQAPISEELKLAYRVIDLYVPFPLILERVGIEGVSYQNIFCPFHDDTGHMSAKLFQDEDGDKIWCFAEHRMFRPSDVYRLGLSKEDPMIPFRNIWNNLPEETRNDILFNSPEKKDAIPQSWREADARLSAFKNGTMSYGDFLLVLADIHAKEKDEVKNAQVRNQV